MHLNKTMIESFTGDGSGIICVVMCFVVKGNERVCVRMYVCVCVFVQVFERII